MRNNNMVETLIGALVVVIAIGFLAFAYSSTSAGGLSGYPLAAQFTSVDGINTGTDVRLHGIKIGTVSTIDLDPKTYMAVVHMSIRGDVPIPDDSAIKVTSTGLLGNPYLSIQPGGSPKNLAANGLIQNTQGSVDLMGLIGRAIYGNTSSASPSASGPAQTSSAPAQAANTGHP
ncbi:MAG TPA: outer membrane lipid asymmetry maintenance protein MlaD [Rhizomicrobium sp.]|jgi:phospholipid/cholesterol/gamma-HCH transport system substrate-binding protein